MSARPVGELVEGGNDAVESIDLPRHPLWIEVACRACDAKREEDLTPARHRAPDANGAIAASHGAALAGVEADGVERTFHLLAEIWILPRENAAEAMKVADGMDDVVDGGAREASNACEA